MKDHFIGTIENAILGMIFRKKMASTSLVRTNVRKTVASLNFYMTLLWKFSVHIM